MTPDRRLISFRNVAIGLLVGWLLVFAIAPNLLVLIASLLSRSEADFVGLPFSVESYERLFDPLYARVLWASIKLAGLSTLVCLAIGYPFAWWIATRPPRWRGLLLLLVIVPFWTNSLIRTYAIKWLLSKQGLVNQALQGLGLIDQPLNLLYTDLAVLLGFSYVLLPFMILPLYAVLEKLDGRLLDAAADLGANRWQRFVHVVWPLSLPGVVAGGLLVFLPAMGMFYVADVLGGARHLLIGNLVKNQFLTARDWPFGSAAATTLTVMMIVLILVHAWTRRRAGQEGATL